MWLYSFLLAISNVVIDGLVKGISKLRYTFTLKINQTVNTLNFTEKNTICLTESDRPYKIFILQRIHISASDLR